MLFRLIGLICRDRNPVWRDTRVFWLGAVVVCGLYFTTYEMAQSDRLFPALEQFYAVAAVEWSLSLLPAHLSSAEGLIGIGYRELAIQYYALTAANVMLLLFLCADLALTMWMVGFRAEARSAKQVASPTGKMLLVGVMNAGMIFYDGTELDIPQWNPNRVTLGHSQFLWRPDYTGGLSFGSDYILWLAVTWGALVLVWAAFVHFGTSEPYQ